MRQLAPSGVRRRKSSLGADGPSHVEVAFVDGTVAVRDTKHREGDALMFRRDTWAAFAGDIKRGDFNGLT